MRKVDPRTHRRVRSMRRRKKASDCALLRLDVLSIAGDGGLTGLYESF